MARAPSPRSEASRRMERDDGRNARPPWLEEADSEESATSTLIGKRTFWVLVIGMLGLIGGVALGVWLLGQREEAPIDMLPVGAEVPLVKSPGAWKVVPSGPGIEGETVPGQDDTMHGAGDGQDKNSPIATAAMPEEPGVRPGTLAETGGEDADTIALQPAPAAAAPEIARPAAKAERALAPIALPPQAAASNGSTLQLGAFSTEGRAREAWKGLAARFSYLAGLTPIILPTTRDGKTLYRLRASGAESPANAQEICAKLKVANDDCAVVN